MNKPSFWRSFIPGSRGCGFIIIGCLFLLLASNSKAQDDSDTTVPLERVASLGGRVVHWVEMGNYLYIGQGGSLRVFDQSDRDHPKPVAWAPLKWRTVKLAVSGSRLWIETEGYNSPKYEKGLECFDISDPARPRALKDENEPDEIDEKLNDDSPLPKRITQLSGMLRNATAVVAGANRAWVRDEQNGWLMLDVTTPSSPKLLGRTGLPAGDRPLALLGSFVYCSGKAPGLRVYKGDQPGSVTLCASVPINGPVNYLSINGKNAYIAAGAAGLVTLDISDLANPRVLARYPTAWPCTSVVAQGALAGIRADDLFLLDVSDPAHPNLKSRLWVSDMLTTGTTEVGPPLAPDCSLGDWTLGGQALVLMWATDYAGNHLQWFDVRNSAAPASIKEDEGDCYDGPQSIQACGKLLFVQGHAHNSQLNEENFQLYDLRNPAKPRYLGKYACFAELCDYSIHDGVIYVADGENGLVVLRLKNN